MKPIFVYGPPGSGKSTIGRMLAQSLSLPFVDLDMETEKAAGKTIVQIMNEQDEATFRELESEALARAAGDGPGVIALGGGTLLRSENRHCVEESGVVLCLEADMDTLSARLSNDEKRRPLLAGDLQNKLETLLAQRSGHYESFPLRVKTDRQSPAHVVHEIQKQIGRFRVHGMGPGYDVMVEPDAIDTLGEVLRAGNLAGTIALVSDSNVGPIYGQRLLESLRATGFEVFLITVPAGEEHKTLETVSDIWDGLLNHGFDRQGMVVAAGGGVIGDLAGFAASTFMRGVDWVCVPTTLLAMVDASLGGKTGFDLPQGKNLIGSFHPPRLVLADPNVLGTLSQADFRSGLAEVVKHGIISDEGLFDLCAGGLAVVKADLTRLVRSALAVKIEIVQQDPYEKGLRAVLNLGHTVGHALEAASGYRLRHGEAVAIGMVFEAKLAERLGVAEAGLSDRISAVLTRLGLPTQIPADVAVGSILKCMQVDKKKSGSAVRFVLPVKIGEVKVGVPVEDLVDMFAEAR